MNNENIINETHTARCVVIYNIDNDNVAILIITVQVNFHQRIIKSEDLLNTFNTQYVLTPPVGRPTIITVTNDAFDITTDMKLR